MLNYTNILYSKIEKKIPERKFQIANEVVNGQQNELKKQPNISGITEALNAIGVLNNSDIQK